MRIPNVPHPDVPQGTTDEDNVEIRLGENLQSLISKEKLTGI